MNRLVFYDQKRDPEGEFHFASLQSRVGQQLLQQYHHSTTDLDSFLYIGDPVHELNSCLAAFSRTGRSVRLLYGLIIIPIPHARFLLYLDCKKSLPPLVSVNLYDPYFEN